MFLIKSTSCFFVFFWTLKSLNSPGHLEMELNLSEKRNGRCNTTLIKIRLILMILKINKRRLTTSSDDGHPPDSILFKLFERYYSEMTSNIH